jgi:hypothetical protein
MAEKGVVTGGVNPLVDFILWLNNQVSSQSSANIDSAPTSSDPRLRGFMSSVYGIDPNDPDYDAKVRQIAKQQSGDPTAVSDAYNERGQTWFEHLPTWSRNLYPQGWPGTNPNGSSQREIDNYLGNTATFGLLDMLLGEGLGDAQARYLRSISAVNTPPFPLSASAESAYHAFGPGLLPIDPQLGVQSTPRGRGVDAGQWAGTPIGILNRDPGNNLRRIAGTPVPNSAGMDWMYPQIGDSRSSPVNNSGFPQPTPTPMATPMPIPTYDPNARNVAPTPRMGW